MSRQKTSSRPSAFLTTAGVNSMVLVDGRPEENQEVFQPPPVVACQMCQSVPSEPMLKTSSRPSAFSPTAIPEEKEMVGDLLREAQELHVPFGFVCQICQSVPSS